MAAVRRMDTPEYGQIQSLLTHFRGLYRLSPLSRSIFQVNTYGIQQDWSLIFPANRPIPAKEGWT